MHLMWLKDRYLILNVLPDAQREKYSNFFNLYVKAMSWRVTPELVPALLKWIDENMRSSLLSEKERELIQSTYGHVSAMYQSVMLHNHAATLGMG